MVVLETEVREVYWVEGCFNEGFLYFSFVHNFFNKNTKIKIKLLGICVFLSLGFVLVIGDW